MKHMETELWQNISWVLDQAWCGLSVRWAMLRIHEVDGQSVPSNIRTWHIGLLTKMFEKYRADEYVRPLLEDCLRMRDVSNLELYVTVHALKAAE